MAAMTTALTEFSNNGNSRTYTLVNHSALSPEIVIQKRKTPSGKQVVLEDQIVVSFATKDSEGNVLPQRISFTGTIRRPINGTSTDVNDALAVFRDIVAGDEFANTVNTQEFLS